MAIAGVVIVTKPDKAMHVLEELNEMPNLTTYGVHNDVEIVAVLEADSAKALEEMSMEIQEKMPDILGFYPTYVTYEDEMEDFSENKNV